MKACSVRSILAFLVGALCVCLWTESRAEISTIPLPRHRAQTLMMNITTTSITDGADPITSFSWQTYRSLPAGRQLNRNGAVRPDGRPDLIYRLPSAAPLVVWAYNNGGGDHDIAFAAWDDTRWGPTHFLTNSADQNERDPRVFYAPGGAVHVVWWVESLTGIADSRIMLSTLTPGTPTEDGDLQLAWSDPERISPPGEHVARPTVAESHGSLWISYERVPDNDAAAPSQIIVRRRSLVNALGGFAEVKAVVANRPGLLNPLLTATHGRLWLDWQHADTNFGFVRLRSDLDWTEPQAVPWSNHSWLGVEDVRQTIRRLMLSANASVVPPLDTQDP